MAATSSGSAASTSHPCTRRILKMSNTMHSGVYSKSATLQQKKIKVSSYIALLSCAVSSLQDCSKHFPGRPVQSDTISTSLGSIQSYTTINARGKLIHISTTARYSFIQLSELEHCRVKKLAQGFNSAAQDSNPGPLS